MATPAQVLKDPNFLSLPVEERRKVLSTIDPNFSLLPRAEQDKVFNVAPSPAPTPAKIDAGQYKSPLPYPFGKLDEAVDDSITAMAQGAMKLFGSDSTPDDRFGGVSQMGRGFMNSAGLPFMLQGAASAPIKMLKGLAVGLPMQVAGSKTAEALGAGQGVQDFTGDLTGLASGLWASGFPRPPGGTGGGASGGTPWNPTIMDRLSRPEVRSAATDFIPYYGPSTGYKGKFIKLGKALTKNPEPPASPRVDPFYESGPVDPWSKPRALPTPPEPIKLEGVGAGSMEYDTPAPKPVTPRVAKPKAEPKPKAPSKQERDIASRSLDPYQNPPGEYVPPEPPVPGTFTPSSVGPYVKPEYTPPPPRPPAYSAPEPGPYMPGLRPAPPDVPRMPKAPWLQDISSEPGMEYQAPPAKGGGMPKPPGEEPPAKMPKTPEEFEAAVQKAKADYEAKQKPVGAGMPPMPKDSTVIPHEGLHPDYTAELGKYGTVRAQQAQAKDIKIAQFLKDSKITPETWQGMSLAEKNSMVWDAGKYKALDKGGKESRGAELGAKHIYNRLVELWK